MVPAGRWDGAGGKRFGDMRREVLEETGLEVKIVRLIGFYSNPDYLVIYPDGNKVQIVAANFEAAVTGGTLKTSDEVSAYGYFSQKEMEGMDILPTHIRESGYF